MKIDFCETGHTYRLNGKTVPSVTQIIKETVGCGWQTSEWYLTRGKAIHACAALVAEGKSFKFDERLSGYVAALKKFFSEMKPQLIGCETFIYSEMYQYAGRLDLGCKISGHRAIIDWKHNIDKVRTPIQIGGYSAALKEMTHEFFDLGFGVEIRENGTYNMTEAIDLRRSRNEFLALRTAYAIKEKCGELSFQKEKE
jgi:hypothetical protein